MSSLQDYAHFCCIEYKSVLSHCETRWLSLRRAIVRTLEMWEPLCSYFRSHSDVEKPGKVRSIDKILQNPFTKPWLLFLSNILAIFDKFNTYFQTSATATIHRLHGECERLLKTVLSFFVKTSEISSNSTDLTRVNYTSCSSYLSTEDIYIGDNTLALIINVSENEGESVKGFYEHVIKFYQRFLDKLLKVFDFRSEVLSSLSFIDPMKSQIISSSLFDKIEDNFPISFDKAAVKLEYREFAMDEDVTDLDHENAIQFWNNVSKLTSPMGSLKYHHLSTLALNLLAIPASNADSERVFSLVRRIKTEYRSALSTDTVLSLIGCHFNNTNKCCENTKFEKTLLTNAKKCTRQRNISYTK